MKCCTEQQQNLKTYTSEPSRMNEINFIHVCANMGPRSNAWDLSAPLASNPAVQKT